MMEKSPSSNHIQTPKSILKGFSNTKHVLDADGRPQKKNLVYKMDMDGNISEQDIGDCNAQKGFYTQAKEDQLSYIESLFGDIKKKILSFGKLEKITFSAKEIDVVKLFFVIAVSRSEQFQADILKGTVFTQFLTGNVNELVMQIIERDFDWFDNCTINIAINKTTADLLLPQRCWYSFLKNDIVYSVFPLSPKIAVMLQTQDPQKQSSTINALFLRQESEIDVLNKLAIRQEVSSNKRAIFSKKREDLERYIYYLKELKV